MKQVYIALGSNLKQPVGQLQQALARLAAHPAICLLAQSSFYQTVPVGYADQPDFVNAVAFLATELPPPELLAVLQEVETVAGRVRSFRNAPRTLDLDIIDYQGEIWNHPDLQLPHPRAAERGVVMVPLAEISPQLRLPGQSQTAAELAAALPVSGIQRLDSTVADTSPAICPISP